jgi:putative acetyltransferase
MKQTMQAVDREGNELRIIRELFREYAAELQEDLCFQSFETEVENPLKKYTESGGVIFLASIDDQPAGCVALQGGHDGLCEMKRLYVKPAYRKTGLGKVLVEQLIRFAREHGFKRMQLDTLQRLQPAIRLYEQFGFNRTAPYYANPIADVVYMEKQL